MRPTVAHTGDKLASENWTIIDGGLAFRSAILDDVTGHLRIVSLLDRCRLIETLVMAKEPVLLIPVQMEEDILGDPLLATFHEEGILRIAPAPQLTEAMEKSFAKHDGPVSRDIELDQLVLTTRFVRKYGAAFVPSMFAPLKILSDILAWPGHSSHPPISDPLIEALIAAPATIAALGPHYNQLKAHTDDTLRQLRRAGRPIPLRLPPIASVVLNMAGSADAIGRCALDLRNELTKAREGFDRLLTIVTSDDASIGDSIDAHRATQTALDRVLDSTARRELVALSEWRDLAGIAKSAAEGVATAGVLGAAGALLGKPLRAVDERIQRRQVLHLAVIADRFREIRSYGQMVQRLFGFELEDESIRAAKQAYEAVTQVELRVRDE